MRQLFMALALLVPVPFAFAEELGTFVPTTSTVDGETWPGAIYLPPGYSEDEEYPLIVFLHGSGERGDDGESQTTSGIGTAIRENPQRFPCLVLMPQCSADDSWVSPAGRDGSTAQLHIDAAINDALEKYSVDEDRVTLTGLSMGAGGLYRYGSEHPDRFAAFMPVCGRGVRRYATGLAKRPIWIFHGEDDNVIPLTLSERMAAAIEKEGGDVKLTTYPGVGHNSWDRAYSKEQGAIEWLLKQKRE